MSSFISKDLDAYNSGTWTDRYNIANLNGGDGATEIGMKVFGDETHQSIDHSKGGNTIRMNEQYGGKKGKKSVKKTGKRKDRKPTKGGKDSRRLKRKSSKRKTSKRKTQSVQKM